MMCEESVSNKFKFHLNWVHKPNTELQFEWEFKFYLN